MRFQAPYHGEMIRKSYILMAVMMGGAHAGGNLVRRKVSEREGLKKRTGG